MNFYEWSWCPLRKCWQREDYRIYPPGKDIAGWQVSSHDVWHDGVFESFEAAARELSRDQGKVNENADKNSG